MEISFFVYFFRYYHNNAGSLSYASSYYHVYYYRTSVLSIIRRTRFYEARRLIIAKPFACKEERDTGIFIILLLALLLTPTLLKLSSLPNISLEYVLPKVFQTQPASHGIEERRKTISSQLEKRTAKC